MADSGSTTRSSQSFRDMGICPSAEELLSVEETVLRKNTGKYRSAEDYLDMLFRNTREDFVQSLRETLAQVYNRDKNEGSSQLSEAKVYTEVTFTTLKRNNRSLCVEVKISPKQIDHTNKKLLMYGSLLVFSKTEDKFRRIVLAKVSDCSTKSLCEGLLGLTLVDHAEILDIKFGASYSMFESRVFFDTYFHILTALQTMDLHKYPLCKYVIGETVAVKKIVKMRFGCRGLTATQLRAYSWALSNNLTLIQGPPGTGKTFLGLKVVKRMIECQVKLEKSSGKKQPPILVISGTNHALDQFLEPIVGFCTKLIRVGRQSQSMVLQEYTMEVTRLQYRKNFHFFDLRPLKMLEYKLNKKWSEYKWSNGKKVKLRSEMLSLIGQLHKQTKMYKEHQLWRDLVIMRDARVVGMTTTSAARLHTLLNDLEPSIMIVDEAATLMEGHVVGALTKHCKQIVMIGDHKQLRPIASCHAMKKYNLDVSLFERLCRNGVPYVTLDTQHRMRPEFAQLLVPKIYRTLNTDSSACGRPSVCGVEETLFFVEHSKPEMEVGTGWKNRHEAKFLIALSSYLILQGNSPGKITIIAMYAAQVKELEKLRAKKESLKGVVISSVDGFQGKENEIVLISLVRSNTAAKIGFLSTVNRVCVALSRARSGLYIIGNMENMTRNEQSIWCSISEKMMESSAVGSHLALRCTVHDTVKYVNQASDFTLTAGGCGLGCTRKSSSLEALSGLELLFIKLSLCQYKTNQDILKEIARRAPGNAGLLG